MVSLFLGTLSGRAKVTMQGPDSSAAFVLVFVSLGYEQPLPVWQHVCSQAG